jgi:Putative beta-lactamase-inhibitor-like, PepSY-like
MNRRRFFIVIPAALLFVFAGASTLYAQEKAITPDQIPKAVMAALLAKFPKATIDKCTKAREFFTVVYDIEFNQEGRKFEADIKENGSYINYETAIEATALPKAVSDAIAKKYPNSVMKEIMEETEVKGKIEKLSAYEVVLQLADGREAEVRVSPAGKILEDTGPGKA